MLLNILDMLLAVLAGVLGSALLLRAYLGWLRFSRTNPMVVFCCALTDWLVLPLRRLLPFVGRLDSASVTGAILVALAYDFPMHILRFYGSANWYLALPGALKVVAQWTLYLVFTTVIINAAFSIINPHAPLAPTFDSLTRPLLAPLRRRMPPVGGFDLSPLVVIVIVQILLYLLSQIVI